MAWRDVNGKARYMFDYDGLTKTVKGFQLQLDVIWQASERTALEFSLPYQYKEFSQGVSYSLNDPSVRRGDGIGDLRLGFRRRLLESGAFQAGARAGVSLPTGLSPFAAQHTLMGSGQGSLQAEAALAAEGALARKLPLWIEGAAMADLGANADIAPGAFKGMDTADQISGFPGGREFVRRQPGMAFLAGFGYRWHEEEAASHLLCVEALARMEGALEAGGRELADTRRWSLEVLPQARFRFQGFAFSAGWVLPVDWARNQAVPYSGELLLRADFLL